MCEPLIATEWAQRLLYVIQSLCTKYRHIHNNNQL